MKRIVPFFVVLVLSFAGCATDMISVDAIEPLVEDVAVTHDRLVLESTTIPEDQKPDYLRSTLILRKIIQEAKK